MELAERHQAICDRMARACERAQRESDSVQLMAVTKFHPPSAVDALADLGVTLFGENRVQEAKAKIPRCGSRITWHMIGHLQTNKVRDAVALFDMIQGVDSFRVAAEISRRAEQADRTMPILLEVNVGGEASKSGYAPDTLLSELNELNLLPALEIQGLMTIPPWKPVAEQARPFFRSLRELKDRCEDTLGAPLPHLSMGMSNDFEVAIEEGATLVRIGTALLGERPRRSPERQ